MSVPETAVAKLLEGYNRAGCDLTTPEGQQQFKAKDLLNTTCKPCVVSVVEILEGIV